MTSFGAARPLPALAGSHDDAGFHRSLARLFQRLLAWTEWRSRYHETVAELSQLTDRELDDIGIPRVDIHLHARIAADATGTNR